MALIALCFAEVGSRFDRTGGPQHYASQALGSTAGFTVGWLLWISRIGSCAAVSNLAVDYGKVLWPQLAHPGVRALEHHAAGARRTRGSTSAASARPPRSTPRSRCSRSCRWWRSSPSACSSSIPRRCGSVSLPATPDLSTAMLLAAYAFVGFDGTTVLAGEVRDPRRSVPFAILFSIACVIVLYTLIQVVCVGTLPNLAASERPLADVALLLAGPVGRNRDRGRRRHFLRGRVRRLDDARHAAALLHGRSPPIAATRWRSCTRASARRSSPSSSPRFRYSCSRSRARSSIS